MSATLAHLTGPLAYNFLAARIAQSTVHVISVSSSAVVPSCAE